MMGNLLDRISKDLLIPIQTLSYLVRSAPYRYKVYEVNKRSGLGKRIIAHPAKEVKMLQYWVMENIFPLMSIHPNAIAYVKGKNIRNNCELHATNAYILKLDFKDFFPSIKGEDFVQYSIRNKELNMDETQAWQLTRILFWNPKGNPDLRLSIGAPSSPYLSNAILYDFDKNVVDYCSQTFINYTRYADDMTFSTNNKELRGEVFNKVKEIIDLLPFPKLYINKNKTVFGSKAHRRMVTGLILSNDGEISLGRDKKRHIRSIIHHFTTGKLTPEQRNSLRGMLSYVRDIEPNFYARMVKRYGKEVITSI